MRGKSLGAALGLSFIVSIPADAQTPPIPVYLSDELVANTVTSGNQRRPTVAGNEDGNFLIAWHSDAAQAGFFDIKGQLFDREGDKVGAEFQVDQGAAGRVMYTPQAAAGGNGNYVVVWADFVFPPAPAPVDSEVWMRRYDSAGNALGDAVQVNTYTTGQQRLPRVAANEAGQFVIVWESFGQDGSGYGIVARLYGANGTPSTLEIPVNTVTTGHQIRAAVDIDDVGFTVVFNDPNTGVEARDIGLAVLNGLAAGLPQYNLFDASHRNADIVYVAGGSPGMWSNYFSVAENHENGLFSLRTRRNWSLDPAIPAGIGFNVSIDATQINDWNVGFMTADKWNGSAYDLELVKFREIPDVSLSLKRLTIPKGKDDPTVPDIGIAGGSQGIAAGVGANDGSGDGSWYQRGGEPNPDIIGVILDNNANGMLDPDESVVLRPGLTNLGAAGLFLTGSIVAPIGIGNSPNTITIDDDTADYGEIPAGGSADCQAATGDCYGITVSGVRPGVHWDESVIETLSTGVHKTWLLHVGESFADVPNTNLFYAFIENLLHNGVTAGGACGGYCPTDGVKRQQMAVFLLKSRFGSTFVPPPATGTIFTDVPFGHPFGAWIEALFLLGVTGGCSGGPPPRRRSSVPTRSSTASRWPCSC